MNFVVVLMRQSAADCHAIFRQEDARAKSAKRGAKLLPTIADLIMRLDVGQQSGQGIYYPQRCPTIFLGWLAQPLLEWHRR